MIITNLLKSMEYDSTNSMQSMSIRINIKCEQLDINSIHRFTIESDGDWSIVEDDERWPPRKHLNIYFIAGDLTYSAWYFNHYGFERDYDSEDNLREILGL